MPLTIQIIIDQVVSTWVEKKLKPFQFLTCPSDSGGGKDYGVITGSSRLWSTVKSDSKNAAALCQKGKMIYNILYFFGPSFPIVEIIISIGCYFIFRYLSLTDQ